MENSLVKPKVFAIVVTYNGACWIEKCLRSIGNSLLPLNTIVVDNCSTDDTTKIIEDKFPHIKLIRSSKNHGFGKSNNIAIKEALECEADYFFLLNQDAWIEKDTVQKLIDNHLQDQRYGILSPIHLNGAGDGIDRSFFKYAATVNVWQDHYFNKLKTIYECNFVNAAAWLVSSTCVKTVGGFNPMFTHYGEDENYCHRLLYRDFKIGIVTNTVIYHDRENRGTNKNSLVTNKTEYFSNVNFLLTMLNINIKNYERFYLKIIADNLSGIISNLLLFNYSEVRFNSKLLWNKIRSRKAIRRNRAIQEQSGLIFLDQ